MLRIVDQSLHAAKNGGEGGTTQQHNTRKRISECTHNTSTRRARDTREKQANGCVSNSKGVMRPEVRGQEAELAQQPLVQRTAGAA
jgi:hypothetical protein